MIPNQAHLFDMPKDVTYLNCAYTSPLLKTARAAGEQAVQAKSQPWNITPAHFFSSIDPLRDLFSKLVDGSPDNVAIIPAVSYGIALAAKNLPFAAGQNIVVIEDQFPSNIYSWKRLTDEKNGTILTVAKPDDSNWTPAVIDRINSDTAIVAVPNCHWTDGTLLDLVRIKAQCKQVGAALVIDATQSLGALPFSVQEIQPDFLICDSHKWLLGAYGIGFCYVDPKWHGPGIPLEENWLNRAGSEDFSRLVDYRDEYQPGARKFDVGGASNFFLAPVAQAALTQILEWQVPEIEISLKAVTTQIADQAGQSGFRVPDETFRSPHLIGITSPDGISKDLPARLAQEKIFVSIRGQSIRIAPHLYTTADHVDKLFKALC
jgi:selenocysteine lyase/cysteine desulfurase